MGKDSKRHPWRSEAKRKGRLVEQIVAWLHAEPGVRVETNVRLPSRRRNRRREIDVLLTLPAAGYRIQIAIECKNRSRIGAPEIDAFVGKLQDVGIAPQLGIFISAGGYTSGARDRARDAGLRALLLEGLTSDGLTAQLMEAVESTIYLVASLGKITIENDLADAAHPWHLMIFRDTNGRVCGNIPFLAWRRWMDNEIPALIGTHQIELTVPLGWQQVVDGHEVTTRRIAVEVTVVGLVHSLRGNVSRLTLREAEEKLPTKLGFQFHFRGADAAKPLCLFRSEEEAAEYLKPDSISVMYRVKAPRMILYSIYYPPTQASVERYLKLVAEGNPHPNLVEVEGAGIGKAFAWPKGVEPREK